MPGPPPTPLEAAIPGQIDDPNGPPGPAPRLDRRALERLAVGAPAPGPPATPVRAIERGARVRRGWPIRPYSSSARRPAEKSGPSAPRISIGQPIARARPAHDLSYEPLYLLVPGEESRRSDAAATLAVEAAQRFSGGRDVVLIDLDVEESHLRDRLPRPDDEGIVEALEFGLSLSAVAQRGEAGFPIVPLGTPPPDVASLYEHERWERVVAHARRDNVRLLAYVPPVPERIAAIGRFAGAVLLLATPEEEQRLRARLPPDTPVVGTIEPAPGASAGAVPTAPPPTDAPRPTAQLPIDTTDSDEKAVETASEKAARDDPPLGALREKSGEARADGIVDPEPSPPAGEVDARGVASLDERTVEVPGEFDEHHQQLRPDELTISASDLERALAGALNSQTSAETAEPSAPAEPSSVDGPGPVDEPRPELAGDQPDPRRYIVPRTTRATDRAIRIAAVLILGYWTYYIGWRWTDTLNLDALWFSVPLALAETWGWLSAILLLFTTWRLKHRAPPPAPPGLSVDVLVTTFDEPLTIIRRTAIGAREIRYPHRTYILDDGRRDEVRAMAEEVGVGYITRPDNRHAKAGNLNNALQSTSGEFILQLDADHAPLPSFLDRVLGFFDDPRVAFVQTPQDFYNLDSFTADVDDRSRRLWEDQKLFFSVIQPGKDNWNSAFFCGSCAAFRRSALDDIGGFSDQTITEDIETSIRLHGRGWKSVYHGESLAYGLAAHSAAAFHIQHGRWARGAMQVFRRFNPLTSGTLSIPQRASYFYSLSGYWIGLQKLIFYLAPLLFFATGVLPVRALDAGFLGRFVPYLVLSIVFVELLARGLGFTLIAERYQMAKFWTYTLALPAYFTNRRLTFQVTPKGRGRVPVTTYAPQLLLMVATVASVYWATLAYAFGWIDYEVDGWGSLAFQLNFLWAGINFALAASIVVLSARLKQRRCDYRFAVRSPISVRTRRPRTAVYDDASAESRNLNSAGIGFVSTTHYQPGTLVRVTLPLRGGNVTANATVVHSRQLDGADSPSGFFHGAKFTGLDLPTRDAIELHCAHVAAGAENLQYRTRRRGTAGTAANRG